MDSPKMAGTTPPDSAWGLSEENSRVKFLCSFSGSILPRPQDGKLRYVGGETRIVSVPRDINYKGLMGKMRELFEGAAVLKYQQPDEDLDALVSVVNDDDVTNMMEEYDKLGCGDGFTRLRIFLFSHSDQDGALHYGDADERDNERRYVDALNSLDESPDSRMHPLDDIHSAEQYFNHMGIEGGFLNQGNLDMSVPPVNLRHLTVPHIGSGQYQQSVKEASWSPVYYSPRQHGYHDSRPITEFPTSPSGCYRTPYGDFAERFSDRIPEDYGRQQFGHPSTFDRSQYAPDNMLYVPAGSLPADRTGFPGNILHGPGVFEGTFICENCRMTFQRNNQQYPDPHWKHGEQPSLESPRVGNGFQQVPSQCGECLGNRERVMVNADTQSHLPVFHRELNDPRLVCTEAQNHDRGWVLQPHSRIRIEEPRSDVSLSGRLNDHHTTDACNGVNLPSAHGSILDGHYVPPRFAHEDPRLIRPGPEITNEERGARNGNLPYAYGVDNHYQVSHGHMNPHNMWRNVHNPAHVGPFEASNFRQQPNGAAGPVSMRGTLESSPSYPIAVESQNPWVESSHKVASINGTNDPEYSQSHSSKIVQNTYNNDDQNSLTTDCVQSPCDMLDIHTSSHPLLSNDPTPTLTDDRCICPISSHPQSKIDTQVNGSIQMEKNAIYVGEEMGKIEDANGMSISRLESRKDSKKVASFEHFNLACLRPAVECLGVEKGNTDYVDALLKDDKHSVSQLSFLPELTIIRSVKKATIDDVKEVNEKPSVFKNPEHTVYHETPKPETQREPEFLEADGEVEFDFTNDNSSNSKIEPTQAEAEAIAKGLQTIKNDDLEEVKELGSGTYGAVYHGKWRGSDVAIKRIKASCFAGKPTERERLIADFWKEALILSSLHHPNVVSFYGIVRDGPDGSLATVTEFMVNGSLKQFLRKKDRTIDRRKRLIIAMDAAFGMEYLHGKNIVHFDLKCENLLVNMRDPHRPICKIGDLGLSKVKQHTLVSGGVRGTLPWMAPELLSGKSDMVTEKIDVYSFGVVMWELLTGDEPYADMHCASIIGGIVNNTLRPEIPSWCDPEWKALMESCWASDPAQRPSFSDISQKLRNMAAAINLK